MKVSVVRDIEGLMALRSQWQLLLDRSHPNHVFMTWEWFFTWWNHFGHGRELFVIAVEDNEEIIGILPLMLFIHNKGLVKVRYLHFIGFRFEQRWNDWIDIIAVRKEEVIQAALGYLNSCQYLWDFLDLRDIPEDSDTVAILSDLSQRAGFSFKKEPHTTCPYLPTISNWEAYYLAHCPRKIREDLDRQVRKLQARGNLQIHRAGQASEFLANLDALFDLNQRRQHARDQPAMFSQKVYRDFYRALVQVFPQEWLDCPVLKLDERPIAAHFSFRYNHKLYYCTPAFDPDYRTFSPGKLLLRYTIESCFADDKIFDFDFLMGREPYKYEWASGERRTSKVLISGPYVSSWIGKVLRRTPPPVRRSLIGALSALQ